MKQDGTFRDIKVNVVYHSETDPDNPISMICEIQLLLNQYLHEKKRTHKLYTILREQTYFEMIVRDETEGAQKAKGVKDLEFEPILSINNVEMNYNSDRVGKCSVDSELGLLGIDGIDWFGCIDMSTKKCIFQMPRVAPRYDWYGRNSHHWVRVQDQRYISVQTKRNEIQMFKITSESTQFSKDESFHILLPRTDTINYIEFDHDFANILLMLNETALETRSMNDVSQTLVSFNLEEKINQSSFRNLRLSGDGGWCVVCGGRNKSYFYAIDMVNKAQHKLVSHVLQDTYCPCFINGDNEFVAVSDKKCNVEIWDLLTRQAVHCISANAGTETLTSLPPSLESKNNILAVGLPDGCELRLYDVRNWECFYTRKMNVGVESLHLTDDLKYLTVAGTGDELAVVLRIQ